MSAPERWKLHRSVVLVGMMGAGKTAVGRALAGRIGVPFLDSDAEIESAANMSIAEIFERDGEARGVVVVDDFAGQAQGYQTLAADGQSSCNVEIAVRGAGADLCHG